MFLKNIIMFLKNIIMCGSDQGWAADRGNIYILNIMTNICLDI